MVIKSCFCDICVPPSLVVDLYHFQAFELLLLRQQITKPSYGLRRGQILILPSSFRIGRQSMDCY